MRNFRKRLKESAAKAKARAKQEIADRKLLELASASLEGIRSRLHQEANKLDWDPTKQLGERILARAQAIRKAMSRTSSESKKSQ